MKTLSCNNKPHGDRAAMGRAASTVNIGLWGVVPPPRLRRYFTDEGRGGGQRPYSRTFTVPHQSPEVYRPGHVLCGGMLTFFALLALPASAQVQFQIGGTAGFGSANTPTSSNNNSAWNNAPLGDAYYSSSLQVGRSFSLYNENLLALRRGRNGFHGVGAALKLETEVGYLGAGLGSYGWRGTGTRLFVGWPTGRSQTFELSYTRLQRGGSTEPVFTYGVRF